VKRPGAGESIGVMGTIKIGVNVVNAADSIDV